MSGERTKGRLELMVSCTVGENPTGGGPKLVIQIVGLPARVPLQEIAFEVTAALTRVLDAADAAADREVASRVH